MSKKVVVTFKGIIGYSFPKQRKKKQSALIDKHGSTLPDAYITNHQPIITCFYCF